MLSFPHLTSAIGTLPFLGPAYEDDSGKVDIHLALSTTLFLSTLILIIIGVISGWLPAMQAAKLDARSKRSATSKVKSPNGYFFLRIRNFCFFAAIVLYLLSAA